MHDEQPTSVTGTTTRKVPVKPPPIPRDAGPEAPAPKLCFVELARLRPDPDNVRQTYDDIEAFAQAIHEDGGILQSLLVRPDSDGNLLIISGHRRYEAAKSLGLKEVPVNIREVSDEEKDALQISENINRSDVSAIELAQRLHRMAGRYPAADGSRIEKIAKRLNRSPNLVRRYIALLKLDPRVVKSLERNRLGISQAVEVARLARAQQIPQALEMASAMKSGQTKRADASGQTKDKVATAPRVFERRCDRFSVRATFTLLDEASEVTFRTELEKLVATFDGVQ